MDEVEKKFREFVDDTTNSLFLWETEWTFFKAGYEAAKKQDGETVGKMIEVIEDTLNKCDQ